MPLTTRSLDQRFLHDRPTLKRYAMRILRDPFDADDLIQEAYIKLRSQDTSAYNLGLGLSTIKSLSIDILRRRKRRHALFSHDVDEAQWTDLISPETTVASKCELHAFVNALERHSPRCAMVYLAAKIDGLSQSDIANREKLSLSTIEKEMACARGFCQDWLSGKCAAKMVGRCPRKRAS